MSFREAKVQLFLQTQFYFQKKGNAQTLKS